MSLISKTQLISDVADAYRTASGEADLVAVGELAAKISELGSGGSGASIVSSICNNDGTITVTDSDGVQTVLTPTYDTNGKVINVTYGTKIISVDYNGSNVSKVGRVTVDVKDAPSYNKPASATCDEINAVVGQSEALPSTTITILEE